MGGRLSMPKGVAGTTEISNPKTSPYPRRALPINSRTIVAPAAAVTMAVLLFVYSRTSIRAAKANAQRHREADSGGEGLNLLNESRRRHGQMERVDNRGTVGHLARGAKEQVVGKKKEKVESIAASKDDNDERLKAMMGRKRRD